MFYAHVQGSLTGDLNGTPWNPDPTVAAVGVLVALGELFVCDDAATDEVTLIGVDTTTGTAEFGVDSAGDVLDTYDERLTRMASWLTGDITVVDDHANAVKHRLRGATLRSVTGRIVYDDEPYITEGQVSVAFNTAVDEIAEAAELPDSGTIDALNLLVNTGLHRLFTDPDASLVDVVDANYETDEEGSALAQVLSWIDG